MITALMALAATLLSGDGVSPCPRYSDVPAEPIVIDRDGGDLLVEHEAPKPPGCFNAVVVRLKSASGMRQLLRIEDEAWTSARVFRSVGLDLLFVSQVQPSPTASWHFARLLWVRPDGELQDVGLQPQSTCGGFELPALNDATKHGGYSLDGDHLVFEAPANPNTPEMVFVRATLRPVPADTGYQLNVSSCKVTRPDSF